MEIPVGDSNRLSGPRAELHCLGSGIQFELPGSVLFANYLDNVFLIFEMLTEVEENSLDGSLVFVRRSSFCFS